ncbi:hypothetical protein LX16_2728 [Stackebrandtia albiflava]|uniref:Uncharacterized protein n=1 Tax=Stackebrandtia albiflava TaxID=406432 RepID=A0A562V2C6_9ACTN|nr:hypothetical protein [Stackebrandtia albiflava]TWJ11983.1 hypothetical protein LX16_2728 [Stackebrandtia albiflava]
MTDISDGAITQAAEDLVNAVYQAALEQATANKEGVPRREISTDDYAQIRERILEATTPHYDTAKSMSDFLDKACLEEGLGAGEVGAVSGLASFIGTEDGQWHGETAGNFSKYYVEPFDNCRDNQIAAIQELNSATLTYIELLKDRRRDYIQAVTTTTAAVDAAVGCGGAQDSVELAVVGTIVAVAAAVPTGGATLAAALPIMSAGATALSTGVAVKQYIEGPSPEGLLRSLEKTLDNIDQAVKDKVSDLASLLNESVGVIEGQLMHDRSSGTVPFLLPHEPDPDGGPPRVTDGDHTAIQDDFVPPSD